MLFIVIIALFIPSATNAACEQARVETPILLMKQTCFVHRPLCPKDNIQTIPMQTCPAGKYTGKVDRSNEYGLARKLKGMM